MGLGRAMVAVQMGHYLADYRRSAWRARTSGVDHIHRLTTRQAAAQNSSRMSVGLCKPSQMAMSLAVAPGSRGRSFLTAMRALPTRARVRMLAEPQCGSR